jgi:hemoglobin
MSQPVSQERAPTLFAALGGAEGVLRLAAAWHERALADEVVAHAFSHGFHPQHTERLAAYWCEAWGGPATYSERYGDESSVVRIHSGNGAHEEMDQRAIACFDQAMDDVGIADPPLRRASARPLPYRHAPRGPDRARPAGLRNHQRATPR